MATRRDFMRMAGAFAGAEIGRHVLSGLGINPETYANAGSIQQENSQEYMLDRAEWYYGKESRIPGITQYAYDHLAKAGTYVVGGADGKGGLIGDIVTLRFGTGVASGKYMLSCEKTINMFNTIINEVAEGRFELQEQYELEIGDVVSHVAVVDEIFEEGVLKHDFHTQSNRSAKVASVTTSQQTPMVIACLDDRLQPFPFASKIEVSAPAMVTGYNFIYAKSEKMILISPKSYQAIVSTDKYCEMSKHEGDFIPSAIIQGGNVIGVPSGANYTYSQEKDAISFEKIPQNLADMLNSQVNWIPLKGQVLDINSYRGMRGLDIDLGLFISNHVSTLYFLGYDEITFRFHTFEELKTIKSRLSQMIGFEIIEQGERSITIKNILGENNEAFGNFETILKRTFIMLAELSQQVLNALRSHDYSHIRETRELESTNNKLTAFCLRLLNKFGYADKKRTPSAYTLIEDIEELADEYKLICDFLEKNTDLIPSRSLLSYLEKVHNYVDSFRTAYFVYDRKNTARLIELRFSLLKEGYALFDRADNREARILHHAINIVTKTYECMGVFSEMML